MLNNRNCKRAYCNTTGLIKRKDAIVVVELSSQWTNMRKQLR